VVLRRCGRRWPARGRCPRGRLVVERRLEEWEVARRRCRPVSVKRKKQRPSVAALHGEWSVVRAGIAGSGLSRSAPPVASCAAVAGTGGRPRPASASSSHGAPTGAVRPEQVGGHPRQRERSKLVAVLSGCGREKRKRSPDCVAADRASSIRGPATRGPPRCAPRPDCISWAKARCRPGV